MNHSLMLVNLIACAAIFWTCASFLLVRGQATTLRQFATQVGLLLAMVGSMVSALAPIRFDSGPDWWSTTLRAGIALIALTQYDKGFGIRSQLRCVIREARQLPARITAWWWRSVDTAHAHRESRQRRP